MSKNGLHQLLLDDYEITELWVLVSEHQNKTQSELIRRRIFKINGERSKQKKYLGEYEKGLIEENEYLVNLEKMLLDLVPNADDNPNTINEEM